MSNKTKRKSANQKKTNAPTTVKTVEKQNLIEYIVVNIICLFVFLAFGYIAIMSFFYTSVIDSNNYSSEVIIYQTDNLVLNIGFNMLFIFILFKLRKTGDFFAKVNLKFLEYGLPIYVTILGLIWVFSVKSIPAADSQNIFASATGAVKGDYTQMLSNSIFYNHDFYDNNSYFNFYPFQLGFVFISEIIYRIFGTENSLPLQVINVLCVAAAYLGIVKITKAVFKRRAIEFFAIIMLAACFQPVLFTTFAYGNIIGMCCAIWASYFLIRYFQTVNYKLLIPCGVLLVLATLAKYNNMIYLAAFVIMLIIHTVRNKKWQSIAFAAAICIAATGASNLVIMSYEARANTQFASGVSQVLYLDTGLTESYMAPGWFTTTGMDIYKRNNFDTEKANAEAWNDIKDKLSKFAKEPEYGFEFFSKKVLSQWNETTYESIWVSKVKSHIDNELNWIAKGVYESSIGQFLELHFNFYMQVIFVLFTLAIFFMFINRRTNIESVLLPLVLLGGYGYHLLFEGKSQYVLTYIILMIPFAAYALNVLFEGKYKHINSVINKLKSIPEKSKNTKRSKNKAK